MSQYKRALIWGFTFGFGLIWVLAFFLPSEIGGGIDRHGMYAPDLLGTRLYYTTGARAAKPLTENSRGAYIVMMDLTATNIRRKMFSSSPFRKDDYHGARLPSVFATPQGLKALYIGIGYDDRRRICLAESVDGTEWTPRRKAVFDVSETVSTDGPNWFIARFVSAREGYRLFYTAMERGRMVVRSAQSFNLVEWKDEGLFLSLPEPESILSFSPLPDGRALVLSRYGDSDAFATVGRVENTTLVERSWFAGTRENLPPQIEAVGEGLNIPFAAELFDLRVETEGEFIRLLVVGGNPVGDGRLRIAVLEGRSLEDLALLPNSQPDGSVAPLSKSAIPTYFNQLAGNAADFVPTVLTLGFGTGLLSLLILHGRRIAKGGEDKLFSIVTLLALFSMLVVQFGYRMHIGERGIWFQLNNLLFMNMQFPLGATMFGLLAAYLVSAAYRAFRIRSFDAAVMATMATLVVLTQVPTAQFIAALFSPGAVPAGAAVDAFASEGRTWALLVVNDAVQRAVGFGAFVGAIAMALRIWLSLDKTSVE